MTRYPLNDDPSVRRRLTPERRIELLEADNADLDRKWRGSLRAITALIVLLVIVGFIYGRHINANTDTANGAAGKAAVAARNLREAEISACKRENQATVTANKRSLIEYDFFTGSARLYHALLAAPRAPQPQLRASQVNEQIRKVRLYVKHLEADAGGLEWRHLVPDCEAVVDRASSFKLNPTIKFREHGHVRLPPVGALRIEAHE